MLYYNHREREREDKAMTLTSKDVNTLIRVYSVTLIKYNTYAKTWKTEATKERYINELDTLENLIEEYAELLTDKALVRYLNLQDRREDIGAFW